MLRFCKKCGTLFSDSLGVCPKCNARELEDRAKEAETGTAPADKGEIKRNWVGLIVGIPAFIFLLYGITWLFKLLTNR